MPPVPFPVAIGLNRAGMPTGAVTKTVSLLFGSTSRRSTATVGSPSPLPGITAGAEKEPALSEGMARSDTEPLNGTGGETRPLGLTVAW